MTINYTLDFNDFMAFQFYNAAHSKEQINNRLISRISLTLGITAIALYFILFTDAILVGVAIAMLGFMFYYIYPYIARLFLNRLFEKHIIKKHIQSLGRTNTLTFGANIIIVSDAHSKSNIAHNELAELIETPKHFFIKLTYGSVIIVPKRCVEDKAQFMYALLKTPIIHIQEGMRLV